MYIRMNSKFRIQNSKFKNDSASSVDKQCLPMKEPYQIVILYFPIAENRLFPTGRQGGRK